MAKAKHVGFHEYRYQILPISQQIQMDISGFVKSIDDLISKKNEFFKKVFQEIDHYSYSKGDIVHQNLGCDDNIFLLRIGVERDLKRKTREFEIEKVENWEPVIVAFNNDPEIQKCIIQRYGGFKKTQTVAKLLEYNFNRLLKQFQLTIAFEPIYEENYFWDLVEKYKERITQIEFELISPNMSNISSNLNFDLAALHKSSNTTRTQLQLNSDPQSFLTPSKKDPLVHGLVEYSSNGGGDISIKAKGLKARLHTSKGVNEISFDEIAIESSTFDNLVKLFKEIMQ